MASPLLKPNLKRILSSLSSPEIRLCGQQLHISNHLEMVTDSLWVINPLIADANLRALEESELSKWVWDVHAVHVDVQNILEVIQDSNWQKPEVSSSNFLHHDRYSILLKLKEIATKLNCLLGRAVAFDLLIHATESIDPNHGDYYSIMREEVIERDYAIREILNILFRLQKEKASMDINSDVPLTILIMGPAGVGKSTLAHMIYHHPLVCEIFKHRAWVDNSSLGIYPLNYDYGDVDFSNELGRLSSNIDIWSLVCKPPPQARCLFVLDGIDIIEQDWDKLEELKENLINLSGPGSTVIITCRNYGITENDVGHRLYNISCSGWKEIFLRYAIPRTHSPQVKQNYCSIKNVDIINLAIGLYDNWYLANILWDAKIFGSISRYTDLSKFDFRNRENKYYKLMKMHYASDVVAYIFLYTSLLEPLPFCSTEESCFYMLIAEGIFTYSTSYQQYFIRHSIPSVSTSLEIFAIRENIYHLRESDQESRIPQWCRYLCARVNSYTSTFLTNLRTTIANNMRTLILYRAKEEMDLHIKKYEIASPIEIPQYLFTNLTILSIIDTNIQLLPNTIGLLLRLRYLNLSEKEIEKLPKSICDLRNLRVLSLSYCKKLLQLPKQIYNLSKLQILKIAHCVRLQRLPNSITSLANLQVLDIEACHWIKELPEDLGHMEMLRTLNMIECASLTQPTGISKLIKVETLSGYKIEDNDHASLALKELQFLMNIKQLHLRHLERVLDLDAITSVNLKKKKYLEYLVLHWEWWNMDVEVNEQLASLEILEGFQPNLYYLQHLDVISYFGMEFPIWMMRSTLIMPFPEHVKTFKYLYEIRLINLKRCDNISFIGLLHQSKILETSGMDSLASVGSHMPEYGWFSLDCLILSEMPILVEWNLRCHTIRELIIIHCPKLIELWELAMIYKVTIWLQSQFLSQDSTFFQDHFRYIEELEIVGCHELRQLPEDISHCKELKTLSIIRCNRLRSLPDWWQEMPRLKQIFIIGCKKISHISKKTKGREVKIIVQGCPQLV